MPVVDCGSVDLSGDAPISVDLNRFSSIGANPCEVKLANESPLTLQVTIGQDQHSLGAWIVDKYPLCGQTSFRVLPSQIQSPAPGGALSNLLLISVAPEGDRIGGTFPAPLPRMASVNQPQSLLGTLTVAANGTQSQTFSIPAGTHAVGLLVKAGACSQLQVNGGVSGGPYLSLPPTGVQNASLQGPFVSAVFSAIDTSVSVYAAAGAAGATVVVVAILGSQAEFVFNNISESTAVGLVGGSGTTLGDTSAPALSKDLGTGSIMTSPAIFQSSASIASFKAAVGQTIAAVAIGAFAEGSLTQVSPLFGAPTQAGNLLVAWVLGFGGAAPNTPAGWTRVTGAGAGQAFFIKPNCGANEVAPVFNTPGGTNFARAQLGEFSGAATAAPTDQQNSSGSVNSAKTISLANPAPDVAAGDLIVFSTFWQTNGAVLALATFAESFNNNATAVHIGDSGAISDAQHASFAYGIVPPLAVALPLGVAPWNYDVQGTSNPAAGTAASVVFAATTGKRYTLHRMGWATLNNGAAGNNSVSEVKDGATVIHSLRMDSLVGAGNTSRYGETDIAMPGTLGNSMTIDYTAGVANVFQSLSAGAYLR